MLYALPQESDKSSVHHAPDELETARLRLRMFAPEDAGELSLITSDPDVMEYIGEGLPLSPDATTVNLASIIGTFKRRGFGRWALVHKELNKLIGYCGLSYNNVQVGVEVAYLLARPYWGQGLATEAARACLRYGFEVLRLDTIGGVTRPGNDKSRRVLERLGMKYVCDAVYHGYDCVHYSISRNEFRPHPSCYSVKRVN
ncbi:MAG TPA: GNAT family N-acetyltransferase [Pyrinomonadaceae bacterium]|nr:GNAT family N-acetyltransferase [Pyrinomonadaceae bacterium]